MNKTININENYGRKVRDEILESPSNLRGEVEIQVKDAKTGRIESQQKHNLIVYGGREWLLKKAFNTNVNSDVDSIANSEILWFGVGNGGGEPGNPLQCGCTYGSDKDLYNPVRMRYEFNSSSISTNPYYASRILPTGEVVNGYYKKITYVSVKEDQANPYKKNNVITYPNLIAELRLEISPDDCCGATYLGSDYEKSYADINEAALFIADNRLVDPGQNDTSLTYQAKDYTQFNDERIHLEKFQTLPEYVQTSSSIYTWDSDHPFPNLAVQYFDIYTYEVGSATDYDYKDDDGNYYKLTKVNTEPLLFGIYGDGTSTCTGTVKISDGVFYANFLNGTTTTSSSVTLPSGITTLNALKILSTGSLNIKVTKDTHLMNEDIECQCLYRNTYVSNQKEVTKLEKIFLKDGTVTTYRYIIPIGYVQDSNGKYVADDSYTNNSIITVIQCIDFAEPFVIQEIQIDPSTLQCKCYVSNDTITKLSEGMKIFTYNDGSNTNKINRYAPAKITDIYNAVSASGISTTTEKSYFIIDREGFVNEVYTDTTKYPLGGLPCKYYTVSKDSPYTMFNRVTFSTIRVSKSRTVTLIWRIYF